MTLSGGISNTMICLFSPFYAHPVVCETMRMDPSPPNADFQTKDVNNVQDVAPVEAKEAIRSEVLKMLSRNLSPHLNDLVDSLKSTVALCSKLTGDVEAMRGSVAACSESVKETKGKVPEQVLY